LILAPLPLCIVDLGIDHVCCTTLQQPTIDSAALRKTRAEEKEKEKKKKKVTFLHEPFIAVHSSGFGLAAKAT